ncbi:hypothetical protein LWI29_008569 [Acer saccharum]|uniref:AAA+ ATPase domain-containing protein n=1 Tax=Acer saccharum TaxID=4024 RepID=A0AA39TEI2_ACESA|nr:hypothetical protein LWI29_008569 [Acer saccharum]
MATGYFPFLGQTPSLSAVLTTYASISAFMMVIRTVLNEMIPRPMREFISSKLSEFLHFNFYNEFTFIVEQRWEAVISETYKAAEVYLPTIIGTSTDSLLVGSNDTRNSTAVPKLAVPVGAKIIDNFEGMRLQWSLHMKEARKYYNSDRKYYHLTCKKTDRDRVLENYFPYIARKAQKILETRQILNIYTYDHEDSSWNSAVFQHPSTFDTLAMDADLKKFVIDDLDTFVNRKGFFDNVGRAWKRGYLLYGPPGTGKSSLVAAIANYLKYHVYDLQLQSVKSDADLRNVLTSTTNRSIILIEDIDCNETASHDRGRRSSSPDKEKETKKVFLDPGATLSGMLNFIDGLWSSCGEERIIIFTTNHKERLDPALLRPGRMDVHIEMGYCNPSGFRMLAKTYLGIKDHALFGRVDELIKKVDISPAEMALHLMKSYDPTIALESLVEVLDKKVIEETDKRDNKDEIEVAKE